MIFQEPTGPYATDPLLADNQSRDLNYESWLVAYWSGRFLFFIIFHPYQVLDPQNIHILFQQHDCVIS